MMRNCRNILIVRLSALGDVIHVLPSLDALRKELPTARISWVVEDKAGSLLREHPQIDELFILPRTRWTRELPQSPLGTLREGRSFFSRLRQRGFDLAIDFHGNLRSGLVTLLSGAPRRIGFSRGYGKEWNHLFANEHVTPPPGKIHKIEKNFALLQPLGLNGRGAKAVIPVPEESRRRTDQFFLQHGNPEGPMVVLHPGVSRFGAFKQWKPEGYARVADTLRRERQARIIFTWGPGERDVVARIRNIMEEESITAFRTQSLLELAAIFARSHLFIGCDTGPLHLANAMGTPVVGLYGPKDPTLYGPFFPPFEVVRAGVPCSPCMRRRCPDPQCMERIEPEQVVQAAERLLAKRHVSHMPVS
jgi:lipopolysaccharide heptosyltransferase I